MEESVEARIKLNVFALPSQTIIIFGLMVVILLGAVLAGSIGPSPIPVRPLAVGLLLLPLRAFLARPEREFARYNLSVAGDELTGLQQAIEINARDIGLRRTPRLIVSSDKGLKQPYAFGTFRHWYIAFDRKTAGRLQAELVDPEVTPVVQAKLVHELYHFKTGDYWQMGYARELLRTMFLSMAWAVAFFCGFGFLLVVAAPDLLAFDPSDLIGQMDNLTPEMRQMLIYLMPTLTEIEQLRQKMESTNLFLVLNFVVSALLPFVVTGGILWMLYWPKLWRVREYYADAGVVHTQGEVVPYLSTLTKIPLSLLRKHPHILAGTPEAPHRSKEMPRKGARKLWATIGELLSRHPDAARRIGCVGEPFRMFDDWISTAILTGSLALLLDVLLVSPLTLLYAGKWPMHFSTLAILAVVSLNLIPQLVQGRSARSDILKIVSVGVSLRLAWLLLTIGFLMVLWIFIPDLLSDILAAFVASSAHFAGYSDELRFDSLAGFIVEASILNLVQVFIIFFILIIALLLVTSLLRRLLTWYGLPRASRRLMRVAYLIIGLMALFLSMTILPLITKALLRPADLSNTLGMVLGATGLILTAFGLGLFLYADGKYAQRCPKCGAVVPGPYWLGKPCQAPGCNELLHPWLVAEYEL